MPSLITRIRAAVRAFRYPVSVTPLPAPMEPADPNGPRFCLILDVENLVRTLGSAGVVFDPIAIRGIARSAGVIEYAFAIGNLSAISPFVQEQLVLAGFMLLHCTRVRNGTPARKDLVDANIHDLVHRVLKNSPHITGVMLATDDQDFAPLLTYIHDLGRRAIVLTPRQGSALGRIAEVLPIPMTRQAAGTNAGWNPDVAIRELREIARAATPLESAQGIARLQILAPIPSIVLRAFLRRFRRLFGTVVIGRGRLTTCAIESVPADIRTTLTDEAVRAFVDALIVAQVILPADVETSAGPTDRFRPNWWNPFCKEVVADIVATERQDAERQRGVVETTDGTAPAERSVAA